MYLNPYWGGFFRGSLSLLRVSRLVSLGALFRLYCPVPFSDLLDGSCRLDTGSFCALASCLLISRAALGIVSLHTFPVAVI
jgi:hypothetical protein